MILHRRNVLFGIASLPASTLLAGHQLVGLTATVYNGYELQTALQAAGAGSSILLAPGNYGDLGGLLRVTQPEVTIRAEPGAIIYQDEPPHRGPRRAGRRLGVRRQPGHS
jgi:hypothetical protein